MQSLFDFGMIWAEMPNFHSFEGARDIILGHSSILEAERIPLLESAGRILAADIAAPWDMPHWDNSAMDGYAVRSEDCRAPRAIRVSSTLAAGDAAMTPLPPGTAVKILTGAPMPPGADAVIPIEETESADSGAGDDEVRLLRAVAAGAHVRYRGEDIRTGEVLLRAGRRIGSAEVSLLASFSQTRIPVIRRPRVAILATGDELVEPGEPLLPGKIHNSNSWALAAAVHEAGALPVLLGIARDNHESLRERLEEGLRADILVTSAGVSAGDRDFVREVLEELEVKQVFWKVDIKPGRPTAFGVRRKTLVFSLPGNPVSSLITFEEFVRPALLKMMGHARVLRPLILATFQGQFSKKPGRTVFLRVQLSRKNDRWIAETAGNQDTGILKTLVQADGIAILPAESGDLTSGQEIPVQILRDESP